MEGSMAAGIGQLAGPGLGLLGSTAAGLWMRRYRGANIVPTLWKSGAGALVAARFGFVAQHWDRYGGKPLAMLDPGDGGFSAMAGLFAAFVLAAELTRHSAAERRPLLAATLVGAAAWVAGTLALSGAAPALATVPATQLQRLDGTPVALRVFTGKPMVVNLWASWCPPCRREMPVLRDAQRRHPDIAFVFVNQGESPAAIEDYLARQRLDIDNVLADQAGALAAETGAFAFPTTLFFDSRGVLVTRQAGGLTRASLEQRLAMLGKAPERQAPRTPG